MNRGLPFSYSSDKILRLLKIKKSSFWSHEREKNALKLFHEAAARVPAYKDFLRKHRVNPSKIKTFKDFELLPTTDKKSYLRAYPLEKLCWDGHLDKPLVFTSTSGSTGEPFYFPRGEKLDWEYSVLIDMFLENSSYRTDGPILVVICFGMGIWIGGLITYKAFEIATRLGNLPVSIITPGINKPEIFKTLEQLAPNFKETIIVAYPPFLKDILDGARDRKINLKKLNIRLLSAAEAYTEKFRDHLVKLAAVRNLHLDTLNIYGTADIGAMAWETPTAILIRRLATKNTSLFESLFSHITRTPTLAQYNSLFITFESPGGEIVLTGNNSIPLIRYSIGDHGGTFSFADAISKLKSHKLNFHKEIRKTGIDRAITQLPFVYVYERSDFSVVLSGANIYPEEVREALHHKSLEKFVTGKFTMIIKNDRQYNEYLEVNLELKAKAKKSAKLEKVGKIATKLIVETLLKKNSEYGAIYHGHIAGVIPKVIFWPYEHPLYFKPGVKQKWTKKQ